MRTILASMFMAAILPTFAASAAGASNADYVCSLRVYSAENSYSERSETVRASSTDAAWRVVQRLYETELRNFHSAPIQYPALNPATIDCREPNS